MRPEKDFHPHIIKLREFESDLSSLVLGFAEYTNECPRRFAFTDAEQAKRNMYSALQVLRGIIQLEHERTYDEGAEAQP